MYYQHINHNFEMYKKQPTFQSFWIQIHGLGDMHHLVVWHLSLRRRCYEEGPNPQSTWPKKLRSSESHRGFGWKIIDSTFSKRHKNGICMDMLVYREFLLCLLKIRRWRWGRDVMVDDLKLQIPCHLLRGRWRCGTEVEYTISTDHLVSFWKTSRGWQATGWLFQLPRQASLPKRKTGSRVSGPPAPRKGCRVCFAMFTVHRQVFRWGSRLWFPNTSSCSKWKFLLVCLLNYAFRSFSAFQIIDK